MVKLLQSVPLFSAPAGAWVLQSGGTKATLDVDFTHNQAWNNGPAAISSLFTCTRASPGYYTQTDGTLVKFGDVARTNLFLHSEDDALSWQIVAVTRGAKTTAPDGAVSAYIYIPTATTEAHSWIFPATTVSNTTSYIYSFHAKTSGDVSQEQVFSDSFGGLITANTRTGVISWSGAPTGGTVSSQALANGWFRFTVIWTTTSTSIGANWYIGAYGTGTGNGVGGVYVWGAQIELVTAWNQVASAYIATTTVAVTVGAVDNVLRYGTNGLLVEEARTNLIKQSQILEVANWATSRASISANTTTAPDGTTTADTLIEDNTVANSHVLVDTSAVTVAATVYTLSVHAKAAGRTWIALFENDTSKGTYFQLSGAGTIGGSIGGAPTSSAIIALANGWYRCSIVYTAAGVNPNAEVFLASGDGSVNYNGDGVSGVYLWGFQLEAGAFATSYIPTLGTSVTRAADLIIFSTLGWQTAGVGTYYAQANIAAITAGARLWGGPGATPIQAQDNTTANDFDGTNAFNYIAGSGGWATTAKAALAGTDTGPSATGVMNNGTPVTSGITGLGNLSPLALGSTTGGSNYLNGYLKRVAYWNTRLSSGAMQTLTT